MTAKEYLSRAYNIDKRIEANYEEIQRLRAIAERATSTYSAVRVSGTDRRSKLEFAIERIDELERKILDDTNDLVTVRRDIRDAINHIAAPEQRQLLQLRYLNGKRWEEIATTMNYSLRRVHSIHSKALQNVAYIISRT